MTSALDMLLAARAAWELTSDQLTIDLEALADPGHGKASGGEGVTGMPRYGEPVTSPAAATLSSSAPRETGGIQTPEPHLSGALRGAETVRPVTNGRRERATALPASPPLPRGEAVRGGLAASPFDTGGRRNLASRRSAAPARREV